ncbi:hypothetical protein [Crocinitomix catalasitica]|uniref:hypothetical protein n=1 Tax=Crocinitomix catalasitica TaxID=184607 RepID=UPI00048554CD|nr:hypothetical protein [Crocinitomix catalasitica]
MKVVSTFKYCGVLLVLFVLASSTSKSSESKNEILLIGKWYHQYGGIHTHAKSNSPYPRWYVFKPNSRIEFSGCTDMCGCMRLTLKGKYNWVNDSTISVQYKRSKKHKGSFSKIKSVETNLIQIKRVNKNQLKITSLN